MVADALIWAASERDLVALETAIGSAVDLNAKDSQGWTALFHAAHNGNTKALQLLIGAGAVEEKQDLRHCLRLWALGMSMRFACFSTQAPKSCK